MSGYPSPEVLLIIFVAVHILVGLAQFLYYPFVRRHIDSQKFPKKSYSVSVIVPVKGNTPTLKANLRSMCSQEYPDYEVIFVAENREDPGAVVARELEKEFVQDPEVLDSGKRPCSIQFYSSGPLGSKDMIAKSHNLLKGVAEAKGEVLLFTDSDVHHPENWIRELIDPIGETVRGRKISASTAIFFIDPVGFLGIFPSLSTNAAAFLASFTRKHQDLPSYASGASMAVLSDVFHKAEVAEAWRRSYNDDLVLAWTLLDAGYHLFSVRRLPTRPTESFESWGGMHRKMVRWMLTVNHYSHPSFHHEVFSHGILNLQFLTLLNLSLLFLLLDTSGIATFPWSLILTLLGLTYLYNVATRIIIALIIRERNVFPYIWLSPISQYFWGSYLVFSLLFMKRFTWGGRTYILKKRYGRMIKQ